MLDDLLSHGHPRLVEKKRRKGKALSLLEVDASVAGAHHIDSAAVNPGAAETPTDVHLQAQQQQQLQQPQQQLQQPQQQQQQQQQPQQQLQQQQQQHQLQPPANVPQTMNPPAWLQQQTFQQNQTTPAGQAPAAGQMQNQQPHQAAGLATVTPGTTTTTTESDEKAAAETRDNHDISGNKFKVKTFFKRVSEGDMIVSTSSQHETCFHSTKQKAQWLLDNLQMDKLLQGEVLEERDEKFTQALRWCMIEDTCFGVRWKLEEVEKDKLWNSSACALSKPAEIPGKTPREMTSDRLRTFYLKKNEAATRDFLMDGGRRASLMLQIQEAGNVEQAVESTKLLWQTKCRCDRPESCRSYADTLQEEHSWCYLADDSLKQCHIGNKEIFVDVDTKKKWSRGVCQKGSDYQSSCTCSGYGMVPGSGIPLNQDVLSPSRSNYGSECQKWNGDETMFKWCYVGWDSPCVDRRLDENVAKLYQEHLVPPQYWSMVACDNQEPNKRLLSAADKCENLEYTVDGVCLLHLFLSMPMVAVLYNYISNQCGDDFQTEDQFAAYSSSGDDDEDEFAAGEHDKADDEHDDASGAAQPPTADATKES